MKNLILSLMFLVLLPNTVFTQSKGQEAANYGQYDEGENGNLTNKQFPYTTFRTNINSYDIVTDLERIRLLILNDPESKGYRSVYSGIYSSGSTTQPAGGHPGGVSDAAKAAKNAAFVFSPIHLPTLSELIFYN